MAARIPLRALSAIALAFACETAEAPSAETRADSADAASVAMVDSSALKACDVITETELERIVDRDLEAARTTNDYAGDSQCRWNLPGDAQRGISISIHEHGDLDNYRRVPGSEPAAGLGDAAVWNGTYGQLALLDGERVLSVGLLYDQPQRAHAEAIARTALATLRGD